MAPLALPVPVILRPGCREEIAAETIENCRSGLGKPGLAEGGHPEGVGEDALTAFKPVTKAVPLPIPVGGQSYQRNRGRTKTFRNGGVRQIENDDVRLPAVWKLPADFLPVICRADGHIGPRNSIESQTMTGLPKSVEVLIGEGGRDRTKQKAEEHGDLRGKGFGAPLRINL
jgi:hypothetical protein